MRKRLVNKKRRLVKKKAMQMVRWISDYIELPLKTTKEECYQDLYDAIKRNDSFYLQMYSDIKSIDLMNKYQCGWWMDRDGE